MVWVTDVRSAGQPNVASLDGVLLQADHNYTIEVTYLPAGCNGKGACSSAHGADPAILSVTYTGNVSGSFSAQHTFNAAHSSSYVWSINLTEALSGGALTASSSTNTSAGSTVVSSRPK